MQIRRRGEISFTFVAIAVSLILAGSMIIIGLALEKNHARKRESEREQLAGVD